MKRCHLFVASIYRGWLRHPCYNYITSPAFKYQVLTRCYCQVDALDYFTSQLMQKKIERWGMSKNKKLLLNSQPTQLIKYDEEFFNLSSEQIDTLFQSCVDTNNVEYLQSLISSCLEFKRSPSVSLLLNVIPILSQNGEKDSIIMLKKLCEECNQSELLKFNSNFQHYIAEAIWVKGDISKAIELLEEVYRENVYLRRKVRFILKYLIMDLVLNKSEAVLWRIIDFAERIQKDYGDYFPLTCVWQACFLSEWFTDQCIAIELLERNHGLCESVIGKIPSVVFTSLKNHRTEVVYRLLELLLKYKMKTQYSNVLVSLLDYQFYCTDLKSCSEIIRWAVENDVDLPSDHHMKLINLLLKGKFNTPLAALKSGERDAKYSLKF